MTRPSDGGSRDDDETLPSQTSDDTDIGWGEVPREDSDDVRRLLDERPPHHEDRGD